MEIEETKTRLVILRQPKKNEDQNKNNQLQLAKRNPNEIQQRVVQIIYKPLAAQKEIFLSHDMYIEFNGLDNEQGFLVYKSLYKQLRPVVSLNHLKQLKFLQVNLDQTQRGILNLDPLINQLDSLQNQEYHQLATRLTNYKQNLHYIAQCCLSRKIPEIQKRNYQTFNTFMNEELKIFLEEQDPYGFYSYQLIQCVDDLSDASVIQSGCNENFIKLLGSDLESYYNLIMRQGFFEVTNYTKRNEQTQEFIDIVKTLFENNFDMSSIMVSDNIDILTLDGIKITAKIVPQIHICYGQDEDGIIPGQKSILGYLYIVKYILDEKQIQYILDVRQNKKKEFSELIYEEPEQSFQHFQYTCSAQHFKEFQEKHSKQSFQQIPNDYQNCESKTCKIRFL
ncbi:hypothetical protein TTHERM_00582220 (macronuclear) [Tetrahymena thermophila SB210]|uniref:Uncharacterized protein n=1 Tax=Tetrahymena thermophila (strain SB210) TaxID=312017 RepID=Q23Q68_TETTS|nr:hypothetical protein TTHERM_00582220 [Tetrahymena thermophila SB210]EAR98716.2 hypothetical protein TTHERM_00582220 [Tetrahymena thermophila SB210]|eukprot:XP_001018961.2 hypothetical protein TTHERM_00582220 [Tetrahymena thermophila SB210]